MTLTMIKALRKPKKLKTTYVREHKTSKALSRILVAHKNSISQTIFKMQYTFQYAMDWVEEHHPDYYETIKPLVDKVEDSFIRWEKDKFNVFYDNANDKKRIRVYAANHFYNENLRKLHWECFKYATNRVKFKGVKGGWRIGIAFFIEIMECYYRDMVMVLDEMIAKQMKSEGYAPDWIMRSLRYTNDVISLESDRIFSPLIARLCDDCKLDLNTYDQITICSKAKELVEDFNDVYRDTMNEKLLNKAKELVEHENNC